ncbi:MAG: DUF1295 domain-containing protein, partial [Rickettsiales bacterium]|nr:DUF1295 domain-containing protein [Rickettsiales bacterium]
VMPVLAVLAVPYVALVDAVMKQPKDRLYEFGCFLLGNESDMDIRGVWHFLLGWTCRGFFLALLFVYAHRSVNALVEMPPLAGDAGVLALYQAAFQLCVALSMVIAISGNVLVLRLMGTHIRSTDSSCFGWWICLVCFQPFKSFLDLYVRHPGDDTWVRVLENTPFFFGTWAALLVLAMLLGLVADATFGNRFSYLTHRGIITNGLYRYSKHPSYVATVLFYALVMLPPMLNAPFQKSAQAVFAVGVMALVYYLRARSEERHLANDPAYVQYALWMEEHGVFRRLGQWSQAGVALVRFAGGGGMTQDSTPLVLPRSVSNNFINVIGLACFLFSIVYCRDHGVRGMEATLVSVCTYGLVVLFLETILLRSPLRPSTGLDFSRFRWNADRVFTKLVGLFGCYAFIALLYWGFPIYHRAFYTDYLRAVEVIGPYLLVMAVPYVALVDGYMKQPQDNYYWFGRLLMLQGRGTSWRGITQLLLGWVVKGYFLPMMFIFMIGDVNYLIDLDLSEQNITFLNLFHPFVSLVFVLDLLAAVAGYMMTFRLFDTHIRSAEPTFMGWFVCLLCYDPFNDTYMNMWIAYRGHDERWIEWLQGYPDLLVMWGTMVFIAIFIYSVAGINFGIRFSNLTHRGVLTNGMYRFTKHPEYISKNFFWWTTFIPFIALEGDNGGFETLRYIILMGGVSLAYFLRARTEERHMSRDPVYVQYALWMNEYGSLAWLGKLVPFFRYKAP